jgi:hypothetical protein
MSVLKGFAISIVVLFVTPVAVESAFRVFDVYRPPDYPPRPPREMFVADSQVGYHLWPSTQTCIRYPPGSHRVQALISNSDGFASSRELGSPDTRPRVLVLGDSFTFGIGVEEGERYTEVVEDLEPSWRVDNMGMTGWGTDLMVRTLETFGPKAQPDVVVLAVYTDDFRRVDKLFAGVGFAYPKYALVNDSLVDVPYPRSWFVRKLHLANLVREVVRKVKGRNHYALNEALVGRFDELTRRLGATPVIIFLPGLGDTEEGQTRRRNLRTWAEQRGIVFGDFTDPLQSVGVEETYLEENWHWNAYGHRIAGEALHALLREVLPPPPPTVTAVETPPWRVPRVRFCKDDGV